MLKFLALSLAVTLPIGAQVDLPDLNSIINWVIAAVTGGAVTTVPGFIKYLKDLKSKLLETLEMVGQLQKTCAELKVAYSDLTTNFNEVKAELARSKHTS